jgi:uncharacterized protein (TIGR03435 family)
LRHVTLFVFLAASALAQNPAPLAFDVASVKINQQFRADDRSTWVAANDQNPGALTLRNYSLTMLISMAWHIERPQVIGPETLNSQRYDIVAKAGREATDDEKLLMLQTLLAERLKLTFHREDRQMDVLAMVVPKGGHKMTPSTVTGPTQNRTDPVKGRMVEGAIISELARELASEAQMPIVDLTGLTGRFDFPFNPQKYVEGLRARVMADPSHAMPNDAEARLMILQDTLAGDLGLHLEPRRSAVNVFVVDHVEPVPVEN